MRIHSLHLRLLLSTGLVLAVFFALAAVALEQGFQKSAELALKEKLQIRIYSLLSAAELNLQGQLIIPEQLRESRFSDPGSGLYAFITQPDLQLVWCSASAIAIDLPQVIVPEPGHFEFRLLDSDWYILSFSIIWEQQAGVESVYVFSVAENAHFVDTQVIAFKKILRSWLLVIALLSLFTLFFVLRWSLRPLRKIGIDLQAIEMGQKKRLEDTYVLELQALTGNLNALISSERANSERYRNTLGDLAHSLKTPLTVMRGYTKSTHQGDGFEVSLQEQISKMNGIVEYQLQRAATKVKGPLPGRIDLAEIFRKIIASLDKVYADKNIQLALSISEPCEIYYEAGDIYEIVGNILDNAYKWCQYQVSVSVVLEMEEQFSLCIQIEDDGPGIAQDQIRNILKRGVRADQNIDGHGIGMAVVQDLVQVLEGDLQGLKSTALGGMMWHVYLP